MNTWNTLMSQLESNGKSIVSLLKSFGPEEWNWSPNEQSWSPLLVLGHLVDEERDDFRKRIEYILNASENPWPSIDPESWVRKHKYAEQSFKNQLAEFEMERKKSLGILKKHKKADWDLYYVHPILGKVTALFFLQNWVAHDHLHMRQLLKLKYGFLQNHAINPLTYAGNW